MAEQRQLPRPMHELEPSSEPAYVTAARLRQREEEADSSSRATVVYQLSSQVQPRPVAKSTTSPSLLFARSSSRTNAAREAREEDMRFFSTVTKVESCRLLVLLPRHIQPQQGPADQEGSTALVSASRFEFICANKKTCQHRLPPPSRRWTKRTKRASDRGYSTVESNASARESGLRLPRQATRPTEKS